MAKINVELLLQMEKEKVARKEMAERFGCSMAAISKKLTKLTASAVPAEPVEPLKIDALTPKEKSFVVAMARGESQTSAAFQSYDIANRYSAKSLGCTLMRNPSIKEALEEIRDREIPIAHLVNRLRIHVDSQDPTTSLKAVDMGLKLHDAYPAAKSMNLNVNVDAPLLDYSRYGRKKQADPGQ